MRLSPLRSLHRGVRHCTAPPHPTHTSATYCTHRGVTVAAATAASSGADAFHARLVAAPHRDATHVPYGEWFTLYVQLRKAWKAQERALLSSSASSSSARTPDHTAEQQQQQQQRVVKQDIDALLWNSLFARHWSEVEVRQHTQRHGSSAASSLYRWWWKQQRATSNPALSSAAPSAPLELCTAEFLTEPLLGGRHLRLWVEDVRASAAMATSERQSGCDSPAAEVLLPFSALWLIKQSAFWRPSADGAASGPPALSLQERQARQALLLTVDQLLQLQCDADGGAAAASVASIQRITVLSPTQEWDMLCQAPQLRDRLTLPRAADAAPLSWLTLGSLCEDPAARLAYCAHTLSWHRQRPRSPPPSQPRSMEREEAEEVPGVPVRVLAPSTEHARLRSYGLTSLHEHSAERAALDRRHAARQHAAAATVAAAAGGATVHSQARRGCSEAVRRMAAREENIRQSFSVR